MYREFDNQRMALEKEFDQKRMALEHEFEKQRMELELNYDDRNYDDRNYDDRNYDDRNYDDRNYDDRNYDSRYQEYKEPHVDDPEWQTIEPLANKIMDAIPMDKIQRLWESGQHEVLVELIVSETDLTVEQAKKVLTFFDRVEQKDYEEHDYYEKDYQNYDDTKTQPYYDDSEVLRLEQRIVELEEENNILENAIFELEEKLGQVNAVVLEQVKFIYDWVLQQ